MPHARIVLKKKDDKLTIIFTWPNADDSFDDSASGSNLNTSGGNKRQRKEKKIFDL